MVMDVARQVLAGAVADGAFPGATLGLLHPGNITVAAAGRFTYEPQSCLVQPDTCYDVASLTKVLATTPMAMLLWQRGKLRLDMRLGDILPAFMNGPPGGEGAPSARHAVTLGMLLAHSSGLPGYEPLFERCHTPQSLLEAAAALPLVAEPGSIVAYSDPGFILLGRALEVLTGETLATFCMRELFAPLEMANTCFNPSPLQRFAIPPTEVDDAFRRRTVQGEVHDENCSVLGGVAGHAGLFSSNSDVLRFAAAMLAPVQGAARRSPFTVEAVRLFTQKQLVPPGTTRTLGWDTPSGANSSAGVHVSASTFGHLGFTGTSLWIDPVQDIAIALLSNRTYPKRDNQKIRTVRPGVHDALFRDIKNGTDGVSKSI